jgi:hypothetical protein
VFRMLWRYSPSEFDSAVSALDWNSYAELSGPIVMSPPDVAARREELGRYVVHGTSREMLLARRGSFRRD